MNNLNTKHSKHPLNPYTWIYYATPTLRGLFLLFLLSTTMVTYGQTTRSSASYVEVVDKLEFTGIDLIQLDAAAASLAQEINTLNGGNQTNFKVLSFGYPSILGSKDVTLGYEKSDEHAADYISKLPADAYYLAFIKKVKGEKSSTTEMSDLIYEVKVKLPGCENYENEAIANNIENAFGIQNDLTTQELNAMESVTTVHNLIVGNTSNIMDNIGFEAAEIPIVVQKSNDHPSLGSNNIQIFSDAEYIVNGQKLTQSIFNNASSILSYGGVNLNYTYFFTRKEQFDEDPLLFKSLYNSMQANSNKIIVWLHFDYYVNSEPTQQEGRNPTEDKANVKLYTRYNLTKAECESIVTEQYTTLVPQSSDGIKEVDFKEICKPSWTYGRDCIYSILRTSDEADNFKAGLTAGFADSLLGIIKFVLEVSKNPIELLWEKKDIILPISTLLVINPRIGLLVIGESIGDTLKETKEILKEFIKTGYENNWEINAAEVLDGISDFVVQLISDMFGTGQLSKDKSGKLGYFFGILLLEIGTGVKSLAKLVTQIPKILRNCIKIIHRWMKKKLDDVKGLFHKSDDVGKLSHACVGIIGCFVKDTPVLVANKNYSNPYKVNFGNTAKAVTVAASMPIVAVPIQDVQLLDYAVAHETVNATYGMTASTDDDIYLGLMDKDPYTSDQQRERDEYQLDDENWNEVVFEEVHGGSTAKLALHNDWIKKKGYQVDAVVEMNLPEQGISGPFRITSIKHIIPQKKPVDDDEADDYNYRPVTALFTHESNQVFNIAFDNGEELGVTYQHPIYSTTAGDWKLAGELEIGEEVLTKSGNTKVLRSTKKEGSETVYNLEVKELHNFLVGENGIVVHNSCWKSVRKQLDDLGVGTNNHRNMDLPNNRKKHKIDKPGSDDVAQKYGKDKIEVCFDDLGFPDFNEWVPELNGTRMEFPINMNGNNNTGSGTGDYGQAFDQMESLLGFRPSQLSQIQIPGYEGIQWTLHHHQDGKTMQLVPKMLNGNTPHVGGKTIMKNARAKGVDHWLPGPSEINKYKTLCN